MSASREKKSRKGEPAESVYGQRQKFDKEAAATRRSNLIYTIIIALVAVAAVFVLVRNSGVVQRNSTAVTINGEKYTAADLQYYYNSTYSSILNQYMSTIGMPPFDYQTSLKDQVYDQESGKTWHDYVLEEAVKAMTVEAALADKAAEEGFELTQEGKDNVDAILKDLDGGWAAKGFPNRDAYLRATYGPYMTYDNFVELLNHRALAADYSGAHIREMEETGYSEDDYQAYYKENANLLDTFVISQVVFQASVETKDAEGNDIEMTEEEKTAALDKAKTEAKANAEAFKARLEAGEDINALITEFGDKIFTSAPNQVRTGASVNSAYTDWAYDAARKLGDVTLAEYDGGTSFNYYVAQFENRFLDESKTADIRHALIAAEAEEGKEPTQEQYDAAKAKAEELLKELKSNSGADLEDAFAEMAKANSADPGSAANGGLITGVNKNSGYIAAFTDWALSPDRKAGDTGLVQNTGSSVKGWHIMYYVGDGDPVWKGIALNAMMGEDFNAWQESISEGYEAETGSGVKYVQG